MFLGSPGLKRLAALAAAGSSCLALAACGPARSTAAPVASRLDPLAVLSGHQLAAEALTNLNAAPTLTMSGTSSQPGDEFTMDLALEPGHGCAGTIEGKSGTIKLVVIGKTVYFKADDAFWKANAGSQAGPTIAVINGRYIKASASAQGMADFVHLCDATQTLNSNDAFNDKDTITKGAPTTIEGTKVLLLKDKDKDEEMYVTDTGEPEIVKLVEGKRNPDGAGELTLSVGAHVTLTPPPPSQVIDGAILGLTPANQTAAARDHTGPGQVILVGNLPVGPGPAMRLGRLP
jgi:hypothetical protein